MDIVKEEMKVVGVTEEEARWRQITGCGNPQREQPVTTRF